MSDRRLYVDEERLAERIGLKRQTVIEYISRGSLPEPDAHFLGHRLWLVETIDEWQAARGKAIRRPRKPPAKAAAPEPEELWEAPPRLLPLQRELEPKGTSERAFDGPPPEVVPAEEALALALAVREAGYFCTSEDVQALLAYRGPGLADRDRELLRQRIIAKKRLRDAPSDEASEGKR